MRYKKSNRKAQIISTTAIIVILLVLFVLVVGVGYMYMSGQLSGLFEQIKNIFSFGG